MSFRLEFKLTANASDWIYVAKGLPMPVGTSNLYSTTNYWSTSFIRPVRIALETNGYLAVRYGGSGSFAFSFTYITSEGV